MNKEQLRALLKVWKRNNEGKSFLSFRRTAHLMIGGGGCWMIHWCGMWLGIEPDGYTHS